MKGHLDTKSECFMKCVHPLLDIDSMFLEIEKWKSITEKKIILWTIIIGDIAYMFFNSSPFQIKVTQQNRNQS